MSGKKFEAARHAQAIVALREILEAPGDGGVRYVGYPPDRIQDLMDVSGCV